MTSTNHVDSYAVVGNPVSHSLSPRIHAEFAAQTGQKISYRAIEVAVDSFGTAIRDLQQQGFHTSAKPGGTMGNYQEIRIRHFHQTLDKYLND